MHPLYLALPNTYIYIDNKAAAMFYLSLATFTKTGKNPLTLQRLQESFMVLQDTETQIDASMAEKRTHPTIFAVTDSWLDDPKCVLLHFDGITYRLGSLMKAIDVLFKVFHLFNIEYTTNCVPFWQFIDAFFYKLQDSGKRSTIASSAKVLLGLLGPQPQQE